MRLEHIPIAFGIFVALVGVFFVVDSRLPDRHRPYHRERRRRQRTDRDRPGEALIGLGALFMAAALVGGELWRWTTVCVLAGGVLIGVGAWRNRQLIRELLFFRGPARRGRSPLRTDSDIVYAPYTASHRSPEEEEDGPPPLLADRPARRTADTLPRPTAGPRASTPVPGSRPAVPVSGDREAPILAARDRGAPDDVSLRPRDDLDGGGRMRIR